MNRLPGWRVLIPRTAGRGSALISMLRTEGAAGQVVPVLTILPAVDVAALDSAVSALSAGVFSWVGFTSVNAVEAVLGRADALGLQVTVPAGTRTAAVGPATAHALRDRSIPVDLVPDRGGSGSALAAVWPDAQAGESVLLPQSEIAATTLSDRLTDKGFQVRVVTAYRTVPTPPPPRVASALVAGSFDAVLFTSPSAVAAMAAIRLPSSTVVGAIGVTTAQAAAGAGMSVSFTAAAPTDQGLLEGLLAVAHRRGTP